MATNTYLGISNDENADRKSKDSNADTFYKMGKAVRDEERYVWGKEH